jgi:hypothetical protein
MDAIASNVSRVLNGIDQASLFFGIGFAILLYFLPTILAALVRNSPVRVVLIGILNFLFGWTGIGWFALIAWAILGRPKRAEEDLELMPFPRTPGTG